MRSLRAVVCARTALPSGSSTVVVVERVAARDARSVLRWRRRVPPILAAIVRLRAHVSIAAAAPLSLPSRPGLRGGRSDSRLSLLSILFFFFWLCRSSIVSVVLPFGMAARQLRVAGSVGLTMKLLAAIADAAA